MTIPTAAITVFVMFIGFKRLNGLHSTVRKPGTKNITPPSFFGRDMARQSRAKEHQAFRQVLDCGGPPPLFGHTTKSRRCLTLALQMTHQKPVICHWQDPKTTASDAAQKDCP
jgi:hypothetical protein